MRVKINEIVVSKRYRKEVGDLTELVDSIKTLGLLQPIVLQPNRTLVAGLRRLGACKLLGWEEIEATVSHNLADTLNALRAERDENTCRVQFLPSEMVSLGLEIEEKEKEDAKKRQEEARHRNGGANLAPPFINGGKTRDKVGSALGVGAWTYEKAKHIVATGDDMLIALMDQESVDAAYKTLKSRTAKEERTQKVLAASRPSLRVKRRAAVLLADPPWKYDFAESNTRHVERHYPCMELEEICNLPIDDIVLPDCVLFLWATAPKLLEALEVMRRWGFTYKTHAVWDKERIGIGYYFRGQHELLLVGTRGNLPCPDESKRPSSVIRSVRGKHSEKPESVYSLLDTMYPGLPKVELFARQQRKGWESWGNEL